MASDLQQKIDDKALELFAEIERREEIHASLVQSMDSIRRQYDYAQEIVRKDRDEIMALHRQIIAAERAERTAGR
jgi:hypothetical protein